MIRMDIQRTDFYNELNPEQQEAFFSQKFGRCLPGIDNIYYTVRIRGDENGNQKLKALFRRITALRELVSKNHDSQHFNEELYVDYKTYKLYRYCLTCPDLFDVFIIDYLPNNETPRVVVQIRSYGLWVNGWEKMLDMSFKCVTHLFWCYDCELYMVRENRIDFCYHNNLIQTPERIFGDRSLEGSLHTTMKGYQFIGRVNCTDKTLLLKDYFALGNRKSNYVYVRFYNKALEVISEGYKGYFFPIWRENGLISAYDEYCMSYAYKEAEGRFNAIHRARLEFYVEHGTDKLTRREFQIALKDKNMTYVDYKALADSVMPKITTVFNVEFETKRKFYHLSDAFIEAFKQADRESHDVSLNRLFQIIDNRGVFLDFLTDTTVSFRKRDDSYCDWWQRLRNADRDCLTVDEKLLRDYAHEMDFEVMKRRFVNNVAVNAVYGDRVHTSFVEDVTDVLANINDNNKFNLRLVVEKPVKNDSRQARIKRRIRPKSEKSFDDAAYYINEYTRDYMYKKAMAEKRLKNRKKKSGTGEGLPDSETN